MLGDVSNYEKPIPSGVSNDNVEKTKKKKQDPSDIKIDFSKSDNPEFSDENLPIWGIYSDKDLSKSLNGKNAQNLKIVIDSFRDKDGRIYDHLVDFDKFCALFKNGCIDTPEEFQLLNEYAGAVKFNEQAKRNFENGDCSQTLGTSTSQGSKEMSQEDYDFHGRKAMQRLRAYVDADLAGGGVVKPHFMRDQLTSGGGREEIKKNYLTKEVYTLDENGKLVQQSELVGIDYVYNYEERYSFGEVHTARIVIPIDNEMAVPFSSKSSLKSKGVTTNYQKEDFEWVSVKKGRGPIADEMEQKQIFVSGEEMKESDINPQMQEIMNKYIEFSSRNNSKKQFIIDDIPEGVTNITFNHSGNEYMMSFTYNDENYVLNASFPKKFGKKT